MAAAQLVLLSSSPARHALREPLIENMSSPNSLPSPSSLIRSKTKLKLVSNGAKKTVATLGQQTAATKDSSSIWDFPDDASQDHVMQSAKPAPKATRKPAKKAAALDAGDTAPPKKRGRPKKVDIDGEAEPAKEKVTQKPRAKKAVAEGQSKILIGRVTKPTSTVAKTKKADQVSAYFAVAPEEFIDIDEVPSNRDLNIEKAVERRIDWTPPKPPAERPSAVELDRAIPTPDSERGSNGFVNLLSNYGYSKSDSQSTDSATRSEPEPARKRKLIELVNNGNAVAPRPVTKTKAVRKKPKTLTEQATRAYINLEAETVEAAPILQYFTRDESAIAPNPRGSNARPKTVRGKKAVMAAPQLLAPEAAHEQARRQQFVFGTSSQLAREEDVGFLRDLHTAMQLSNQEDPFAEDFPPPTRQNALGNPTAGAAKPSLWEAAALIEAEGADEMQFLDLTHSSQVEKQVREAREALRSKDAGLTSSVPGVDVGDGWLSIDDTPAQARITEAPRSPALSPSKASTAPEVIVSVSEPAKITSIPLANPPMRAPPPTVVTAGANAKSTAPLEPQCPDYETYSTTDLSKEIAKYKFKPIKKRDDMIALLRKCWEGKHKQTKGVLQTKPAEKPPPPTPVEPAVVELAPSPKKGRGRPKKGEPTTASMRKLAAKPAAAPVEAVTDASPASKPCPKRKRATKKVLVIEDISDTDNPPAKSPSRTQRAAPPLPLVALPSGSLDDLDDVTLTQLSPTSAERELNRAITRAIKAEPRSSSSDPSALSWQERIMLYDPIMLEDLTKWLNEEGLSSVKYDGEVQPVEVQRWCRAKSICCLSKESTRNGNRKGATKKIGK